MRPDSAGQFAEPILRALRLPNVRLVLRVPRIFGLAAFALSIALAPQTAGAPSVPKTAVVEITSYGHLGLAVGSGPAVVVSAKGRPAAAVRAALTDCCPSLRWQECVRTRSVLL